MTWSISEGNGIIQLRYLVPLNVLCESHHDSGFIGGVWIEHHQQFAKYTQ